MPDYIPQREADALTFLRNLSRQVTAHHVDFGVSEALAATLAEQVDAFAAAYLVAQDNMTRSPGNIVAKDTRKRLAIQTARSVVRICQSHPGTSDSMRADLGITIRKTRPTPGSAIATAPSVSVTDVRGTRVTVNVSDPDLASNRRKPTGALGAMLYYHVGPAYPADDSEWTFAGLATRHDPTLALPRTLPAGTLVWITARWITPTAATGPRAHPVPTHTHYTGAAITATEAKLAA